METAKSIVFDFVGGRISPCEFIQKLNESDDIYIYLQSIVKIGQQPQGKALCLPGFEYSPYDVRLVLGWIMADKSCSRHFTYLNIHYEISRILKEAYPEKPFEISTAIEDRYNFYLFSIPDYIKGDEVIHFIDDIIDSFPVDMKKGERTKRCTEELKKAFHIEGRKFPRWLQGAEWPMGSGGVPMRFAKQERIEGGCRYTFIDVKNEEKRIIEQQDYSINS